MKFKVIILFSFLFTTNIFAQNIKISGTVVDGDKMPVIGAGILCQGNNKIGTISDLDGNFTLDIPQGEKTLIFSSLGMVTKEYILRDIDYKKPFTITLDYDQTVLDQAVVTGYAQTTVKRITGSVGIINSEKFEAKPLASVSALMQGEVAGVSISATSGQPGTQSRIRIRGANSISGSSDPLWVIDGVPLQSDSPVLSKEELSTGGFDNIFVNGIGNINPNDIETITILKDAAAAAIYGSRAANGVIVVSTKRGKAGRTKVNYSNNFTLSFSPQKSLSLMNSSQKLDWEQELWDEFSAKKYNQSLSNSNTIYPIVGIIGQIRAGVGDFASMKGNTTAQDEYIESLKGINTNWYDHLFRNAFSHNHHLSLGGGSDKYTYYVAMGYNNDGGMLINNSYQRYNINANVTITPIDRIKLDIGLDAAQQTSTSPDSYVNAFQYAYFANPYEAVYDGDGNYAPDRTYFSLGYYNGRGVEEVMPKNGFNILRELNSNSTSTVNWTNNIRGSIDFKILKSLKFVGLASYSFSNNSTDKIVDKNTYTAFRDRLGMDDKSQNNLYGNISQNRTNRSSFVTRGHFAFNQDFGTAHNLSILAGAEIRGSNSNTLFSKRYNYDPKTGTTSLPPISGPEDEWVKEIERLNGEYFTKTRYVSVYASADYYFDDRFVINGSFRTDGSSNFGSNKQFNPTWSAGAAWHIAEEDWFENQNVISHATLRAAYGFTGDISTSTSHLLVMQYLQQQYRYFGDTNYLLGVIPSAPNPNLGWEKTQDLKVGLDIGFFKDRLKINTEGYYRLSSDVVSYSQIMATSGFNHVYFNSADIMNSGIETTISGDIIAKRDFGVKASINFAYNFNKVLKYKPSSSNHISSKDRYVEGYPIGAILSGKLDGIDEESGLYSYYLRSDAEIKTAADLNKPDNYRYYLGTTIAPFTGGLNIGVRYKIVSLNINGVYSFGAKVYDKIVSPASYYAAKHEGVIKEPVQSQFSDLYSNHLNVNIDRTDRWTTMNTTGTKYPRIYDHYGERYNFESYNPMDYNIVDAIYLKDISYLRIKNIVLSCKLPSTWIEKIRISSASANLSLNNFFTFTSYDGMDPEVPGATYPTTRSVSFGLNIGF